MVAEVHESRNAFEDIWGPKTPYKHELLIRVDERITDLPDRWVRSACVLCRCGTFFPSMYFFLA